MSKYLIDQDLKIDALSFSQMNTFLKCRKQWEYKYKQKIYPRSEFDYLSIGKLAHAGLASFWLNNKNFETGIKTIVEEFEKNIILMEGDQLGEEFNDEILNTAKQLYKRTIDNFDVDNWEVHSIDGIPAVELRFAIPSVQKKKIQGFIDLVAKEKSTGALWQIDWKFVSSLGDADEEMYNMQNVVYQYALYKMGSPVVGSITYKVLNKPSTIPKINKDGSISRALIRCTWEEYAEFVKSNGLNPEDYIEEMKPKLAGVEYVNEIREYRNLETIIGLWKEHVVGLVYEMTKKQTRYPMTISAMTCRMCPYSEICQSNMRGYDTQELIKSQYTVSETV